MEGWMDGGQAELLGAAAGRKSEAGSGTAGGAGLRGRDGGLSRSGRAAAQSFMQACRHLFTPEWFGRAPRDAGSQEHVSLRGAAQSEPPNYPPTTTMTSTIP